MLAFDQRLISLHYLCQLVQEVAAPGEKPVTCYVVSGGRTTQLERLREDFKLGSGKKRVIALCSDALAESINLQQASALVLLDMPGVLRVVEQRIGRIERLDSPHAKIATYWPCDPHPIFQLNADQRLRDVVGLTDLLIGNNVTLPTLTPEVVEEKIQSEKELFERATSTDAEDPHWPTVSNAFLEVRALVEGPRPLVPPEVYAQVQDLTAGALCRISLLQSHMPWSFFALPGDAATGQSPRWILWRGNAELSTAFTTDLRLICAFLREQLQAGAVEISPFEDTEHTDKIIRQQAALLRQAERELLPPRKARALRVSQQLVKYQRQAAAVDSEEAKILRRVEQLFTYPDPTDSETVPDYDGFAQLWLNLLRPALQKLRDRPRKSRQRRPLVTLESLLESDARPVFTAAELTHLLACVQEKPAAEFRVVACVVGWPHQVTAAEQPSK